MISRLTLRLKILFPRKYGYDNYEKITCIRGIKIDGKFFKCKDYLAYTCLFPG